MTAASASGRLAAALAAWRQGLPAARRWLIEALLAGDLPCYALGRNGSTAFIARHLPLAGVMDDFAPAGERWQGLPLLPGEALPAGAAVLNAVLHRRPHQALARLGALAARPAILHYSDLTRYDPARFPPLPFVAAAEAVAAARGAELDALARRLADDESRRVLHDLLLYRLSGDPAFTRGYRLRDAEQYFDLPLGLPAAPAFVDGGAFRGETSEQFCDRYPDYRRVLLFEPTAASLAAARERLRERRDIAYFPYALGDQRATLAFDDSAADASRVTAAGGAKVDVVPLDAVADGPVDFIKFDLEGYEVKALAGARQTLRACRPALAVCVYHRPEDWVEVPQAVLAAGHDYAIRLRHYTEGWEETVMYFTRT